MHAATPACVWPMAAPPLGGEDFDHPLVAYEELLLALGLGVDRVGLGVSGK